MGHNRRSILPINHPEVQEWYKKLKDSGFKDEEVAISASGKVNWCVHRRDTDTRAYEEEWFRALRHYAYHKEKDVYKREVLLAWADGDMVSKIAARLGTTYAKIRYICSCARKNIQEDINKPNLPAYLRSET